MGKSSNTNEVVYSFVCDKPGLCTYEISKRLGMSGGRIRHALFRLQQMSLIQFRFERHNPRIKKLTYPIPAFRLLPNNLKKELKKMA